MRPYVLGAAGSTIAQYANPGGERTLCASELLQKAFSLAPSDKRILGWERLIARPNEGDPHGRINVNGREQLLKRTQYVAPELPRQKR